MLLMHLYIYFFHRMVEEIIVRPLCFNQANILSVTLIKVI